MNNTRPIALFCPTHLTPPLHCPTTVDICRAACVNRSRWLRKGRVIVSTVSGGVAQCPSCPSHLTPPPPPLPGTLRQLPAGVADGESCSLHLIADHLFHRAVGGASISATVAYMTNVISMVDRVYRSTVWGGSGGREFRNIGVHIANVGGYQGACPGVGVAAGCTFAPSGLQVTVLTEAGGVGYNSAGSPEQEVVPHQLLAVSGRGWMPVGLSAIHWESCETDWVCTNAEWVCPICPSPW